MGLLSLPSMMKRGYAQPLSTGVIAASGTLGQIIPPSIVLVLLGDVLSSAYQQAQLNQGIYSPETVSVGDLFVGAIIPGLMLVASYLFYVVITSFLNPGSMPSQAEQSAATKTNFTTLFTVLLPPLFLILSVLGSIIFGLATITEAAGVGAAGAILLAYFKNALNWSCLLYTSPSPRDLSTSRMPSSA